VSRLQYTGSGLFAPDVERAVVVAVLVREERASISTAGSPAAGPKRATICLELSPPSISTGIALLDQGAVARAALAENRDENIRALNATSARGANQARFRRHFSDILRKKMADTAKSAGD